MLFRENRFSTFWGRTGDDTWALAFGLFCRCFLKNLTSGTQEFDPHWGFKAKVGDRCAVLVTVQNDEFWIIVKCCIFPIKFEYLMFLGRHKKAKISQNIGIYSVWATSLKSTAGSFFGLPDVAPKCPSCSCGICLILLTCFESFGASGRSNSIIFAVLYWF